MGACGSKARRCIGMSDLHRKKHGGRNSVSHKLNKIEPSASKNLSCSITASKGNGEFDPEPEVMIESESSNGFHSAQDDFSQSGSGSFSTVISPRFYDTVCCNSHAAFEPAAKHQQSFASVEPDIFRQVSVKRKSSKDPQLKLSNPQNEMTVPCPIDKVSSRNMDKITEGVRLEKRKSAIPSSPGTRRKSSLTKILSFKRRESYSNSASYSRFCIADRSIDSAVAAVETQVSSKASPRRPVAGSQIPCSPLRIKLSNSWSSIEPNTFRVRGKKYIREKKKEFAPNHAAFYPFGVDVFLSPRKIEHIARFVELPAVDSSGVVPPILVVNLQIPLYPPTIFQNQHNGEGISFVFYFKLSENYSNELPVHFQENIQRLIRGEIEKIRGFPVDKNVPFRDRLKFLARVVNIEDLQLSAAEQKLMSTYNEKPVLSRPQHEFYLVHSYSCR